MRGMDAMLYLILGVVVFSVIFAAAYRSAVQVSGPVKLFFEVVASFMLIILISLILVLVILLYEELISRQFSWWYYDYA